MELLNSLLFMLNEMSLYISLGFFITGLATNRLVYSCRYADFGRA